ncbi:hypothetical protein Tco_0397872 [Tanacetum coccineum]
MAYCFLIFYGLCDRLIPDNGDLRDYWIEISFDRDFLGPVPSYVLIRDPVRRLCHRIIAYSISGRGQAPKKVIDVDLFYLCNIDHGTTNVSHLLAQYLFWHSERRKSGSWLSRGHFIGRLAMHFGLVSDEGLRGQGPERQQAAAAGAHEAGEASPAAEEVASEIPAPAQAPPPPPPTPQPWTITQPNLELYLQYKMSGEESAPQMAPVESLHAVSSVKLPILKKGEYTL